MTEQVPDLYGQGARALQDHFDSRRLADRLSGLTVHTELTDKDQALIANQSAVYIATVDDEGWPDVSYKGGDVGFVRVVDEVTLELPSFDGNGMFRTLGHVAANGRVGLLFIDSSVPWRMRVQGTGEVIIDPETVAEVHGAEALLRIHVQRVFPNCGRYIHSGHQISASVPRRDHEPPEPDWKKLDAFADALPQPR